MLHRTGKSRVAPSRDRSTSLTRDGARDLAKSSARTRAREQLTALADGDLSNWLMECIADASENFLCAVAEAAIAANAEDYLVIRPTLLALKRKHHANHAI